MNHDKNITIDLSKYNVQTMGLNGIKTLKNIEETRLYWNEQII